MALGIIGIICWFDLSLAWAGFEVASNLVDWALWILLNAAFLFFLDWSVPHTYIADWYAKDASSAKLIHP